MRSVLSCMRECTRYARMTPDQQSPRYPAYLHGEHHTPGLGSRQERQTLTWPTLAYDGIENETLPFLHDPLTSVPSFFPWKDFSVEWRAWPYAIGDREED